MSLMLLATATVAAALVAARGAVLLDRSASRRPLLATLTILCAMGIGLLGAMALGEQRQEIDARVETRVGTALLGSPSAHPMDPKQIHGPDGGNVSMDVLTTGIASLGGFLAAVGVWTLTVSPERRPRLTRATVGFALASGLVILLGAWSQAVDAPREIDRRTADLLGPA